MEKIEMLEKLLRNAKTLRESFATFAKYAQDSHCDKHGFGFCLDDRFKACRGLNVTLDSWKGYYGNSGCSTIFYLDEEIFNRYLDEELNARKKEILSGVAERMEKAAAELSSQARKELEARMAKVDALTAVQE